MIKAKFIRGEDSNFGTLTVYNTKTEETVTVGARSGSSQHRNSSWVTGKSPIPRSSEVIGGKLWIWINPSTVKQTNQLPKHAKDIGEFWCISDSKTQSYFIRSACGKFKREAVGGHLDNFKVFNPTLRKVLELGGFLGSSGCVVINAESENMLNKALAIRRMFYDAWKSGQEHVELEVI
jgi:hypothetical protein